MRRQECIRRGQAKVRYLVVLLLSTWTAEKLHVAQVRHAAFRRV